MQIGSGARSAPRSGVHRTALVKRITADESKPLLAMLHWLGVEPSDSRPRCE